MIFELASQLYVYLLWINAHVVYFVLYVKAVIAAFNKEK